MDQFISKPLKRFLYNSKEFSKRRKEKNNLNAVQYSAGSDEAVIKMAEIKSIMRMNPKILETNLDTLPPTTKQVTKNNVLFSDSIETINSDGSHNFDSISDNEFISDNNNSSQLVKVKLLTEPVKETATILNLNPTNKSKESNGLIQDNLEYKETDLDNFTRQSVVKIKVKVIHKNNFETNDSKSDESNTETVENKSFPLNNSLVSNDTKNNTCDSIFAAKLIEELQNIDKTYPSITIKEFQKTTKDDSENTFNNSSIPPVKPIQEYQNIAVTEDNTSGSCTPAKSIEEFQNIAVTDKHNVGDSCIFADNKTRPLSPIPVVPPQISPKTNPFRTVDNLIDFHERQVHKTGRSPPKTLPRMGTSALLSPSKHKLDDSEIISELVRDRFIVNMYETRSYRRSFIKKPSTYGRIYKSLERTANYYNNDFIAKQNLLNSDIVTIKQSSPIKLKDQLVSLQTTPARQPSKLEQIQNETTSSNVDRVCHDVNNILISQEQFLSRNNESIETLYEEEFQKTPSSEYGSGSNLTLSLEQQLGQISESHTFGSDVSSYNMEDFLKKALGDELNNMDNTEVSSKDPQPLPPQEDSITTSNASDLISKINTFQSSLYRSFTRKLQHVSDTLRLPHVHQKPQDKQSVKSDLDSLFSNNEEVTALLRQAAVQYEALKQISKALTLCRNSKEFCVSSEQVEGERLLLVATYKRQAILDEIRRLEYDPHPSPSSTETGCATITSITLPLKPSSPEQPRGRDLTKWYVAVFSSGLQVTATQPTAAALDGHVKFVEEVVFKNLPTEFEVNVEVFCLTQRRQGRNFSHESKYHINKDTKRSHCPTPKKFLSREKSSQKTPARYDTGIRTSSFKLCGSLKLTVGDLTQSGPWELRGKIPLCSALQGSISLNLKSSVQIPAKQSGFLTVGSESGGFASWNRRWCVLDGHVIRYWNYPSDEEAAPLKELDLKYCVSSKVQAAERSICARPRTLLLEIARRPKPEDCNSMMMACGGSYTVERHYLSADTLADLNVWQEQLDKVVQALRIWNFGFLS